MQECCKDQNNMREVESDGAVTVYECEVCGRKHRVMEAEAGEIGLQGSGV